MILPRLLLTALFTFTLAGAAQADLRDFMADVNTSYVEDALGFQARLQHRFPVSATKLRMVILSVDSPGDAVVTLWVHEQLGLPLTAILRGYQQQSRHDWRRILTDLGISDDGAALQPLLYGEDDWSPLLASLH